MNLDPVIHHVELCVQNLRRSVERLKKYGFQPYLRRSVPGFCDQVLMKLNRVLFLITEKDPNFTSQTSWKGSQRSKSLTVLCPSCEDNPSFDAHVDTVFNICFHVTNVQACMTRIENRGCAIIIKNTTHTGDDDGDIAYSIIKSVCGNVLHTLINKDRYHGEFLPGFIPYIPRVDEAPVPEDAESVNGDITHIDHVTLCTYSGLSQSVIKFYEACFGMRRVSISNSTEEDAEEGLILKEGVGLKLKAMEYWRCAETGLACASNTAPYNRLMLVVVESLPGQTNCNVETFLKEHRGPGVEHVALASKNITRTVQCMKRLTVQFRTPPITYYRNLRQMPEITEIEGLDLSLLENLGILIDRENDLANEEEEKPKYLQQIFALPIFDRKTFFLEIIQRSGGARGLGAKNVLALVRSIREEEKRKAEEEEMKKRLDSHTKTRDITENESTDIIEKEKRDFVEKEKRDIAEKEKRDIAEQKNWKTGDEEEKRKVVIGGEDRKNIGSEPVPSIRTC